MIEGIVTVEIVPSGTTNRELRTGKARRALLVVPVDGMSLGKIVSLKNASTDAKWDLLLDDEDLDLLRPMTIQTLARRDDIGDDDEAWEREERLIVDTVSNGVVVKTSVILDDEDDGSMWSFTMPKPTPQQVEALLGVRAAEPDSGTH